MRVHAATACLPGRSFTAAVAAIAEGICEPAWGTLCADHVQLCPQHPERLDEATVETLEQIAPGTRFRLHANVYALDRRVMYDASTFDTPAHRAYFEHLAALSRRINAPAYSLHAGHRHHATVEKMRDNVLRVQDLFGVPTAVEPLYPVAESAAAGRKAPQLLDTWADLEWLMASDLHIALDLSHVAIIARKEGRRDDLVADLLQHPRLIELHVSDNDGRHDEHRQCGDTAWWQPLLSRTGLPDACVAFSEGNVDRVPRHHTKTARHTRA